jgi:hypothetical protein
MCAVGENNNSVSTNIKIMDTDVSEEYSALFFRLEIGLSVSFRSCLALLIPVHSPATLVFTCMLLEVRKMKCLVFVRVKFLSGRLEANILYRDRRVSCTGTGEYLVQGQESILYRDRRVSCTGTATSDWLTEKLIPYFSLDNAHLMYNAHPKLFDIPFDV